MEAALLCFVGSTTSVDGHESHFSAAAANMPDTETNSNRQPRVINTMSNILAGEQTGPERSWSWPKK